MSCIHVFAHVHTHRESTKDKYSPSVFGMDGQASSENAPSTQRHHLPLHLGVTSRASPQSGCQARSCCCCDHGSQRLLQPKSTQPVGRSTWPSLARGCEGQALGKAERAGGTDGHTLMARTSSSSRREKWKKGGGDSDSTSTYPACCASSLGELQHFIRGC